MLMKTKIFIAAALLLFFSSSEVNALTLVDGDKKYNITYGDFEAGDYTVDITGKDIALISHFHNGKRLDAFYWGEDLRLRESPQPRKYIFLDGAGSKFDRKDTNENGFLFGVGKPKYFLGTNGTPPDVGEASGIFADDEENSKISNSYVLLTRGVSGTSDGKILFSQFYLDLNDKRAVKNFGTEELLKTSFEEIAEQSKGLDKSEINYESEKKEAGSNLLADALDFIKRLFLPDKDRMKKIFDDGIKKFNEPTTYTGELKGYVHNGETTFQVEGRLDNASTYDLFFSNMSPGAIRVTRFITTFLLSSAIVAFGARYRKRIFG